MSDNQTGNDAATTGSASRKPYRAPELLNWGTMRDLTSAVGASGNKDGAKKGPTRTR